MGGRVIGGVGGSAGCAGALSVGTGGFEAMGLRSVIGGEGWVGGGADGTAPTDMGPSVGAGAGDAPRRGYSVRYANAGGACKA